MTMTMNRKAKPDTFDEKQPHVKLQKCSHGSFLQKNVLYTAKGKKVEAQVAECHGRRDQVRYVIEGEEAFDARGRMVGAWDKKTNDIEAAAPSTETASAE